MKESKALKELVSVTVQIDEVEATQINKVAPSGQCQMKMIKTQ